ncbi:MAG: SEC-C domain-containing protein [Pontiellaceae bacterium]|nr:SEC-C domain-containing protein [Pontiellaceae bacterium]
MDLMDRIYSEISSSLFRSGTSMEAMKEFFSSLRNMQTRHASASALGAAAAQANTTESSQPQPQRMRRPQGMPPGMRPVGAPPPGMELPEAPKPAVPVVRKGEKVGRNDPCPCGSGRKYKKCCGSE